MVPKKILYLQYTHPAAYPSLGHSSRMLAQEGWQVLFLGIRDKRVDPLQFPSHPKITVKHLNLCPPGWLQKFHYFWFCLWAIGWVISWRPQWIYVSDLLPCPLGLLLSHTPTLKTIYHEHDSPSHSSRSPWGRFCLWSRRKLALRSSFCILPNQNRAERFTQEVGKSGKIVAVWNCPTQEEILTSPRSRDGNDIRILYHGSIVPSRLPLTVLQALSPLPPFVKLRVIGYETAGHKGYVQQLLTLAVKLGLEDRVEILGPMARAEVFACSRDCDIGLSLIPKQRGDTNFRYMVGASNKPFDYLACGLALLVSDLPEWEEMYVKPGYGLACNPEDPRNIGDALQWLINHPEKMREMGERGRQKVEKDWNYESQFLPILRILNGNAIPVSHF